MCASVTGSVLAPRHLGKGGGGSRLSHKTGRHRGRIEIGWTAQQGGVGQEETEEERVVPEVEVDVRTPRWTRWISGLLCL